MNTRVTWWIRDGYATFEASEVVPGKISLYAAEMLLDRATAKTNHDLKSLPKFCAAYYSCAGPDDWGIVRVENEV